MWIPSSALEQRSVHPFYSRLNQFLDEAEFDEFVEHLCAKFYAVTIGRPGLAPGVYFRCLFIGEPATRWPSGAFSASGWTKRHRTTPPTPERGG